MLLDTHVLLWLAADDPSLGSRSRDEIAASEGVPFMTADRRLVGLDRDGILDARR